MSVVQINTVIDQEFIKKEIQENLEKSFREIMFVWDINEMSKRLCMGKTFLEAEILRDSRMRVLQRQKPNSKRFWFYKESLEVIKQIMDEWE
ncbi:hypothetical protein MKY15_19955 [Sporosarcina sp. FSL K6-1540]|uniref:hypothetical protein n=1 Tax=Sporosarcina sp. FSL K6-1540 TaxID=2921555 RepID=UPI00315A44A0